ncbi:MAG: hypothetical protein AB9873_19425 [Syntrophobacteraceae bacterium]
MAKYLKPSILPSDRTPVYLPGHDIAYLGLTESQDSPVYVSLKYYDSEFECFSDWDKQELRAFSGLVKKLVLRSWNEIKRSAGGLGCKVHKDRKRLPQRNVLDLISPDSTLVELRVTDGARIHGFIVQASFFLVWLNKRHRVYKE